MTSTSFVHGAGLRTDRPQIGSPLFCAAAARSDDIRKITEAARGVFEHVLVGRDDFPNIIVAAGHGDPRAFAICGGIGQWLSKELNNPQSPLCLICDTEFTPQHYPASFSVSVPFVNPVGTMVSGICKSCAARDDLPRRAIASLRNVWPALTVERRGRS